MPTVLVNAGILVEAQPVGPPVGVWAPIGMVTSFSGSEYSKQYSEITGKSDTIVQRYPGLVSPGTITFEMLLHAQTPTDWLAWRQAIQHGANAKYNIRVNCGPSAPGAYLITLVNCTVSGLTIPQPKGDLMGYSVTFQLNE